MPAQTGLTVAQGLVRGNKESQELFGRPLISEGRSPRGNYDAPGDDRLGGDDFGDLRISVIAPAGTEGRTPENPRLESPKPSKEVILAEEDDLAGMVSSIKQNERRKADGVMK